MSKQIGMSLNIKHQERFQNLYDLCTLVNVIYTEFALGGKKPQDSTFVAQCWVILPNKNFI